MGCLGLGLVGLGWFGLVECWVWLVRLVGFGLDGMGWVGWVVVWGLVGFGLGWLIGKDSSNAYIE